MNDAVPQNDDRLQKELDELNRLCAAAKPNEASRVIETWVRKNTQPDVDDALAHFALSIGDLHTRFARAMVRLKKLVVVIHGIRDQGVWMEMVKDRLANADVFVQPIDFDFFDVVKFMTGFGTPGVIREVTKKIRVAQADHAGSELIIIAHSFGTYVVTEILMNETDVRCKRAVFCGAVVSKSFEFDRVPNRPVILNDCGDRDIWPVLAQGFSLRNPYGATGVFGIRQSGVEDRFHDFMHSDYLRPEFVDEFWKPYVDNGEIIKSRYQASRRNFPWWVSILGRGLRYSVLFLILAVFLAAFAFWLGVIGWTWSAIGVAAFILLGYGILILKITFDVRKFRSPPTAQV